MRPPAVRLPAVPDVSAAIEELDALLARETDARAEHERALAGVRKAQTDVQTAEASQRDAQGADGVANAVAAVSVARDTLAVSARDLLTARDRHQVLAAEAKAAWRTLVAMAQPMLAEAEEKAEVAFSVAAAALGQARGALNEIRAATGGRYAAALHIASPGNPNLNAAEVEAPAWTPVPHVDDLTRLRLEFEERRTMR